MEVNYFNIGLNVSDAGVDLCSLWLFGGDCSNCCVLIGHFKEEAGITEALLCTEFFQGRKFSLQIPYKSFPLHLIEWNGVTYIPTPGLCLHFFK